MEHAEETLARLVAERLSALGTNAFAIERSSALPADAVRSILSGGKKSGTALNKAKDVCDALGLEFYFGAARAAPQPAELALDGDDFAALPLHAARASAGPGAEAGEDIARHLLFRRDWLRAIAVNPRDARLLHVQGDSMAPLLADGDLVMIDTARTLPPVAARRRMFVLRDPAGGGLRLKRVSRPSPDQLVLCSENAACYPPEAVRKSDLAALGCIGQVVWWAHTVSD